MQLNVVHSICYTIAAYEEHINIRTHFQGQIQKNFLKRHFLSFALLYLLICSCKFVIIETRAYHIAHDRKAMSS